MAVAEAEALSKFGVWAMGEGPIQEEGQIRLL